MNQASIAIARARLLVSERQRADEQKALLDTMADLSSERELSKLLQAALERAVRLLAVTGGELAIYDEDREELVVVASHNIGKESTGVRLKLGEGAMGTVAETHEPLIIPNGAPVGAAFTQKKGPLPIWERPFARLFQQPAMSPCWYPRKISPSPRV